MESCGWIIIDCGKIIFRNIRFYGIIAIVYLKKGEKTPVVIRQELYHVLTTSDGCVLHGFAKFCGTYHRFCENEIL